VTDAEKAKLAEPEGQLTAMTEQMEQLKTLQSKACYFFRL